jgi:hypothetical protein
MIPLTAPICPFHRTYKFTAGDERDPLPDLLWKLDGDRHSLGRADDMVRWQILPTLMRVPRFA